MGWLILDVGRSVFVGWSDKANKPTYQRTYRLRTAKQPKEKSKDSPVLRIAKENVLKQSGDFWKNLVQGHLDAPAASQFTGKQTR